MGKTEEREWLLEEIFKSWEEYEAFYDKAAKFSSNGKRANGHLKRAKRRYLEIEFKSIKAARYYYPENSEAIVLQIPSRNLNSRARGIKRMKLLTDHQKIIGSNEIDINDHIAMRMKVMGVKVRLKKKR